MHEIALFCIVFLIIIIIIIIIRLTGLQIYSSTFKRMFIEICDMLRDMSLFVKPIFRDSWMWESRRLFEMIGHHSRLRDMMGLSYPIYACTSA